ncbi:MAG: DUF2306 domain-containing protein [Rhodanobacteraceae bacterium]|nr:DUF2306 domain-containing protein [Rhodanobacteraceae bacterium]
MGRPIRRNGTNLHSLAPMLMPFLTSMRCGMWGGAKTFGRWSMSAIFALACLATAYYAFSFLLHSIQPGNSFQAKFAASGWDVPAHFFGAGLALTLVPLQLSAWVRRRWLRVHRLAGWLSVAAIVIGALSGFSMAFKAHGGAVTGIGFGLLAVLWFGTTANGLRLALRGDLAGHRRWMCRSLALTSAAVTLRLMLGIGLGVLHLPFMTVYVAAAWLSWMVNLAVCEVILRWPSWREAALRDRRSVSSRAVA